MILVFYRIMDIVPSFYIENNEKNFMVMIKVVRVLVNS